MSELRTLVSNFISCVRRSHDGDDATKNLFGFKFAKSSSNSTICAGVDDEWFNQTLTAFESWKKWENVTDFHWQTVFHTSDGIKVICEGNQTRYFQRNRMIKINVSTPASSSSIEPDVAQVMFAQETELFDHDDEGKVSLVKRFEKKKTKVFEYKNWLYNFTVVYVGSSMNDLERCKKVIYDIRVTLADPQAFIVRVGTERAQKKTVEFVLSAFAEVLC